MYLIPTLFCMINVWVRQWCVYNFMKKHMEFNLHLKVEPVSFELDVMMHITKVEVSTLITDNNDNNNNNNHVQRHNSRFFTISSLRHELSPTRTLKLPWSNHVQIMCNTWRAYHMQHVMLRATWYKGTAQLLGLTEFKSHLFELYFIDWTIKQMNDLHARWKG